MIVVIVRWIAIRLLFVGVVYLVVRFLIGGLIDAILH